MISFNHFHFNQEVYQHNDDHNYDDSSPTAHDVITATAHCASERPRSHDDSSVGGGGRGSDRSSGKSAPSSSGTGGRGSDPRPHSVVRRWKNQTEQSAEARRSRSGFGTGHSRCCADCQTGLIAIKIPSCINR